MSFLTSSFNEILSAQFSPISDDQLQEIHYASLEVLERTGVRLHNQEAIDMLKKAGAYVSEGNRVRIPSFMVEKALNSVPKRVVLCDRFGNRVMPLEGRKSYFGTGSDCLNILDHRTGERRKAILQDVIEAIRVLENLENMNFVMSTFMPWDVPNEIVDRYQMEAMLSYTSKPIVNVSLGLQGLKECVEMAEVVAGGEEELRKNPFIANYVNLTSDLLHNEESLEQLLYFAKKGLPTTYVANGNRGAMAPVTPAGALAHLAAGNLTGLVLSQLKREGTPFIFGGWGIGMDMKTSVFPYASPDMIGLPGSYANYLGIPYFGLAGCSDSKTLDGQATAEAALTLMGDILTGANLIHDVGYLESGLLGSLEMLVICDDIIGWIKRFMQGFKVDKEALALDEIDKVGPDGDFIQNKHTFKHFKDDWYPNIMDRGNHESWVNSGAKTINERANDKVESILNSAKPQILSEEIEEKIHTMVKNAEAEIQ
ncbi:MAG: trimethylamine methyltransferase family protein [Proteobacteria bacterium]|nr:trimethylamine methyltransferase family protein [Pseudomonadota bacterium]